MRFHSTAALLLLTSTRLLSAAPSAEYTLHAKAVISPKHTFQIEQHSKEDHGGSWEWQTWIMPLTKRSEAYQLPLSRHYPSSYGADYYVSPDERVLFRTQKTGSGEYYGALFIRGRSGHYEPADVEASFDAAAWRALDARMHLSTNDWKCRYHEAIEFICWEPDRETFEIALRGQHCYEHYFLEDWRIHYDLRSKKFFMTADERKHNQRSFRWKNWRRPNQSGLVSSVGASRAEWSTR